MKKYKVIIEGKTPYMQHRMDDQKLEEWEKKRGRIIERDDVAKEDLVRAEFHMYRDEETKSPYIPAEQIRGSLINAGAFMKSKVGNAKKSMKNVVAGMFYVFPEKIMLTENWVVDKRSAVNKNIKARVICIRPKWKQWQVEFELHVDNDTITEQTVRELLDYAGNYCGVGSFRPTNNGMFGRFDVKEIKSEFLGEGDVENLFKKLKKRLNEGAE